MHSPKNQGGSTTAAERPGRVLIVDDNHMVRRLLVRALSADPPNHEVDVATSARAARGLLEQQTFDVVITDISMPEEDGISLMRWAREHCPPAA